MQCPGLLVMLIYQYTPKPKLAHIVKEKNGGGAGQFRKVCLFVSSLGCNFIELVPEWEFLL